MARYFFNVVDEVSKNVMKDVEGCEFSCVHEARKEAINFARDIAKHGFGALNQTGEVVVTNESGTELLKIPLSGRRATARAWFDLRQRSARLEAVYGQHTLALLLMAALMFIIVHTADKKLSRKTIAVTRSPQPQLQPVSLPCALLRRRAPRKSPNSLMRTMPRS